MGQLEARQAKWRVLGYALVALTSFLAGAIPLLQVAVQIAAVLVLHLVLLRRELRWLSPARRILTRITIKMLGAAVTCFALTLNVGLAPFPGVASIVLGLAGPILTAAYVEGGLTIIRRRIRAEAEGERVGMGEWFLPTLLATLLVVAVLATVGLVAGTLHLLSTMEIPTVSDVSQRLMELGQ